MLGQTMHTYQEVQALRLASMQEPEEHGESTDVLVLRLLREQEQDAASAMAPARLKYGKDRSHAGDGGVEYQRCGGGVRVVRKKIGGG